MQKGKDDLPDKTAADDLVDYFSKVGAPADDLLRGRRDPLKWRLGS